MSWDPRSKVFHGEKDYAGAAKDETYGKYLWDARKLYQAGLNGTTAQVRELYRRVALQLHDEIKGLTPGTLRRAHLTALAKVLDNAVDTLREGLTGTVTQGIQGAVQAAISGPEKVTKKVLDGFFHPSEVKWMFASINERAIKSLLTRTRHGLKLSDRVWRIGKDNRQAIRRVVEDGVTRGLDSRKLAKQVQQYVKPDVFTVMKAETRRNLGVSSNVSFEAMRLARSEVNNAFHEGTVNAYTGIPSALGVYFRMSASHPLQDQCDVLASHNGTGFFPQGEEPSLPHSQCKCSLIPAMEDVDKFTARLHSWMNDKGSQPDIEQWYQNNARQFLTRPAH